MLMFAILAVFIAGLMVGRTPEHLGVIFDTNWFSGTLDEPERVGG
jgi:K+-transporting ATPase A subunit